MRVEGELERRASAELERRASAGMSVERLSSPLVGGGWPCSLPPACAAACNIGPAVRRVEVAYGLELDQR